MKPYSFLFLPFIFFISITKAQTVADSAKQFLKKYYSANQKFLDIATSGIGIESSEVKYGDNYQPVHFNKIVVRAKKFEFKVGLGNCYYNSPQSEKTYNTQVCNWSVGINQPISVLGIGRATSTKGVRLLPFIAADFGHSTFKDLPTNAKPASSYHLTVAPGYRLKIPYLIVEFRLNSTCNFMTETKYHENFLVLTSNGNIVKEKSFNRFNFTPSIILLLDGLFSKFNPTDTKVSGSIVVYDKITSKDYYLGEKRNEVTGKSEKYGLYRTESTYEFHSESIELPISNIGAFLGIGPRLLFRPTSKNSYRMPSLLGGFGMHGRIALFSMGINVDKGTAGFSSMVRPDRSIYKIETQGKGSFDVTNVSANVGVDLGPVVLGLLGAVAKRNGETPYFSFNGGIIYGYSFLSGFRYNDPTIGPSYQTYFAANPDQQTIFNDASLNKSGAINGWYIGADVGAVGFKYEFNKYKNAPLARCAYYTLSYKYPLFRSKRKK